MPTRSASASPSADGSGRIVDGRAGQARSAARAEGQDRAGNSGRQASIADEAALPRDLFAAMYEGVLALSPDGIILQCNPSFGALLGHPVEHLVGQHFGGLVHVPDQAEWRRLIAGASESGSNVCEVELESARGINVPARISASRMPPDSPAGYGLVVMDLSERQQFVLMEKHRSRILQKLVDGAALDVILDEIVAGIEAIEPAVMCSILLLDDAGKHLQHGASRSLPGFYNAAIDGLAIGEGQGCCGTAAQSGTRVIAANVFEHPYWVAFRDLARRAGIASCWSEPIKDSRQRIVGTFAIYRRTPAEPGASDIALITQAASLASIAIERKRAESELAAYRDQLEVRVAQRTRELESKRAGYSSSRRISP